MRIAIGGDHAGIDLKHAVKERLKEQGHEVLDKGTLVRDSVDYPDFAHAVAKAVQEGDVVLGIVICGSGNGVNISANKHPGIRSALAWNPERLHVAHGDLLEEGAADAVAQAYAWLT